MNARCFRMISLVLALAVAIFITDANDAYSQGRGGPSMSGRFSPGSGMSGRMGPSPMSFRQPGASISRSPSSMSRSSAMTKSMAQSSYARSSIRASLPGRAYTPPSVSSRISPRLPYSPGSSFYRSPIAPSPYSRSYSSSSYRSPYGLSPIRSPGSVFVGGGSPFIYSRYGSVISTPYSFYQPYVGGSATSSVRYYSLSPYPAASSVNVYATPLYSANTTAQRNPSQLPSGLTQQSLGQDPRSVRIPSPTFNQPTASPINGDPSDPATKLVPGMILPDGSRIISVGGTSDSAATANAGAVAPASFESPVAPTQNLEAVQQSGPSILNTAPEPQAEAAIQELPEEIEASNDVEVDLLPTP